MEKTTPRKYPCNRAAMRVFAVIILFASLCTIGADTFKYFPGDYRELIEKLPPPPADDSIAGMADVETLLQVQKDRTPAQIARADFVVVHNAMKMATRIFGPEFTKENLPRTALLMVEMTKERGVIVEAAKEKWNRPRPYKRGLGIEPCVRLSSGTSYPSGHSAAGSLWAVLWSEAFPEFREWFHAEAREIMWCRVLAGVHYPTDTQAGRMLGAMIAAGMLKTPATQTALDEIRAEASEFFQKHPDTLAHAREVARNSKQLDRNKTK